jgi:hypothetical protein
MKTGRDPIKRQTYKGVVVFGWRLPSSQQLLLPHRFAVFLSIGLTTAGDRRIIRTAFSFDG